MAKPRPNRYAQLSESQRQILHRGEKNVVIREEFNSYVGPQENLPFFQKALGSFRATVDGWVAAEQFIYAFICWSNNTGKRRSSRIFESAHSQFKNGLAKFLTLKGLTGAPLSNIDSHVVNDFGNWLKKEALQQNGKKLSPNTQRKYYGLAREMLLELAKRESTKSLVAPDLFFPDNPFPEAHKAAKPTEVLDDHSWHRLIEACRNDVVEIMESVESGWQTLNSNEVYPDETKRGRGRYSGRDAALWGIKRSFPGLIPGLKEMGKVDKDLAESLHYIHGQSAISRPFYPLAEDILPFVLLHAIYTVANTGPLRSMKWKHVKIVDVLSVKRVTYTFMKKRGHTAYQRSFAIQENDKFSPLELHNFIRKWTANIRKFSGIFKDNVYIFVTNTRVVRGFESATDTGRDSDSSWSFAIQRFLARHGLPKVTLGIIRNTGLDVIRDITQDDMRAVQTSAGHKSQATTERHYDGAGARRRRHEALSPIMQTQERWAKTGGQSDPRHSPNSSDALAATPGWICLDPYDSPIPGEPKGALCQAFGRCPACPLASLDCTSGYTLARVLQLAEEVRGAQTYLDAERWKIAYEPVLSSLINKWIPSFTDPTAYAVASAAVLNPIGKLE